jgi:type VI secretion system secreted protein VgrG
MTAINPTNNRLLTLNVPAIEDTLLLTTLEGECALSTPYAFRLSLLSDQASLKILGESACVSIHSEKNKTQYFHGLLDHLTRFHQKIDGFYRYQCTLKPRIAFLGLTKNSRSFQRQTIPNIIKKVLKEHSIHDVDFSKLTKTYPTLDYCVQYQESALAFVSRLMARCGLYYYFEHHPNKHVLVLEDCGVFHQKFHSSIPLIYEPSAEPHFDTWQAQQSFEQTPTIIAAGNVMGLSPGKVFTVHDHALEKNKGEFFVQQIRYTVCDNSHRAHHFPATQPLQTHQVNLTGGTTEHPFVAPIIAPAPKEAGVVSAITTGPENRFLFTDNNASIKVHFHWDREGPRDENSSPWFRTRQYLAGNQWGTQFLPRIGQEIITSFLKGNPDRVIVLGAVNNATHLPAFALPAHQARFGLKTQTVCATKRHHGHQFYLDDTPGKERIHLQSSGDIHRHIKQKKNKHVGRDAFTTIEQGHQKITLQHGELCINAKQTIRLRCGQSEIILGPHAISIQSDVVALN